MFSAEAVYQNSVIKENTMNVVQVQKCSQSQTPVINYRPVSGEPPCIPSGITVGRIEECRPAKEFNVVQSAYANHPKIINSMKNIVLENVPAHKGLLAESGEGGVDYHQPHHHLQQQQHHQQLPSQRDLPHHLQFPKGSVLLIQKTEDGARFPPTTPSSPGVHQQQTSMHMLSSQVSPAHSVKSPVIMDNSVASSSKGEPDLNIGNIENKTYIHLSVKI